MLMLISPWSLVLLEKLCSWTAAWSVISSCIPNFGVFVYIFFICKFNVHQECIWNVLNGVLIWFVNQILGLECLKKRKWFNFYGKCSSEDKFSPIWVQVMVCPSLNYSRLRSQCTLNWIKGRYSYTLTHFRDNFTLEGSHSIFLNPMDFIAFVLVVVSNLECFIQHWFDF